MPSSPSSPVRVERCEAFRIRLDMLVFGGVQSVASRPSFETLICRLWQDDPGDGMPWWACGPLSWFFRYTALRRNSCLSQPLARLPDHIIAEQVWVVQHKLLTGQVRAGRLYEIRPA